MIDLVLLVIVALAVGLGLLGYARHEDWLRRLAAQVAHRRGRGGP